MDRLDAVRKMEINGAKGVNADTYVDIKNEFVSRLHVSLYKMHEEQLRAEGLNHAVSTYFSALAKSRELKNLLRRRQAKHEIAQSYSGDSQYLREVVALKGQLARAKAELIVAEDSLARERSWFSRQRQDHLSRMMAKLALCMLNKSRQETCFWFEAQAEQFD
jgi:hypothetical protein